MDSDFIPTPESSTKGALPSLPCLLSSIKTKISAQCPEIRECMEKQLEHLSSEDKETVINCWETFNNSSSHQRDLILTGILLKCSTNQLSYVSHCLRPLLKIDFISNLPREVSLKVLSFLDAKSLVQASSVSKMWQCVAEDDSLWRTLCDQHINKKCIKCGWGLPLLLEDYLRRKKTELVRSTLKRQREVELSAANSPALRDLSESSSQRFKTSTGLIHGSSSPITSPPVYLHPKILPPPSSFWKFIYRDRLSIERNWRRGKFVKQSTPVHISGVHCQQSNQDIIITGNYSPVIDIFCMKTGKKIRSLVGHFAAIRDLYFDDVRLVTVSHDNTIRIWCYREGVCKRIIPAPGARCLHFEKDFLVVGLTSGAIHLWNFRNTTRHSLVGHTDSITKVRIFKGSFLVSSSDDGTARLWDLNTLECIRVFEGHTASVTCFQFSIPNLFPLDELKIGKLESPASPHVNSPSPLHPSRGDEPNREGTSLASILSVSIPNPIHNQVHRAPLLVTGSADNTIRVWSLQTGACLRQSFGHLGEITSIDMDSLRIVSSSMDGTIKVWDLDSGKCMHSMLGGDSSSPGLHPPPMLCATLADTRILAGSQDGRLYSWDCSYDAPPPCSLKNLLAPIEPEDGWMHHHI